MRDAPARRWPLHPKPGVGEALSSWLSRLAALYSLSVLQLLENNAGPASALARRAFDDGLDWDPPAELLDALAERTGTTVGDLRLMTIAGWVPWLADTLEVDNGSEAFHTYARQDSVLLPEGEAGINAVDRWRPWVPVNRGRPTVGRICPVCTTDPSRGTPLTATLPLMLSCPEHRCRLEDGSTVALAATLDQPLPHRAAPEHVLALDSLTHEGLATGTVTLPRRTVHVGVWLRLLRTLLDEVSISTSRVRQHSTTALDLIWSTAGLPSRAGLNVWRPYERLDSERQEAMLEAAACALNLVQTGAIVARGTLGPLLIPMPYQPAYDGTRTRPLGLRRSRLPEHDPADMETALKDVFEAAKTDQATARWILQCLTWRLRTTAAFDRERDSLILMCGIPAEFLPEAHEWDFERPGPFGIM
ncbi:TniQ family protein [Nonomuraea typhae]|uniref:TniQ family protein n=1 Tax=Nonomuraea typhae TaxID=2603600 RepID=UPI0012F87936|nr:TniQ family protein [Nonomuraea typhae]